jgi:hypothetical protein
MIVTYRPIDWIEGIPGDLYRVGDDGSVWRWLKGSSSRIPSERRRYPPRWRKLETVPRDDGHVVVTLSVNQRTRQFQVARLVLRAFSGPQPLGHHAYYLDGEISNVRLDNLRWAPRGSALVGRAVSRSCGEDHPRSFLTNEQILDITELVRRGFSCEEVAEKYGLGPSYVSSIARGKRWRHVDREPWDSSRQGYHGSRHHGAKLREEDVLVILDLAKQGTLYVDIGNRFGVASSTVKRIVGGEMWKHVTGGRKTEIPLRRGDRHPRAALRQDDIPTIRLMVRSGRSKSEVARMYGVTHQAIAAVISGKSWSHVPDHQPEGSTP